MPLAMFEELNCAKKFQLLCMNFYSIAVSFYRALPKLLRLYLDAEFGTCNIFYGKIGICIRVALGNIVRLLIQNKFIVLRDAFFIKSKK